MKNNILTSLIAGAVVTAVAAFSSAQAQVVPLTFGITGTATYNTNINFTIPGGGTNTVTQFNFNTATLISLLNGSSQFTNELWQYTYDRSYAASWNATLGNKGGTATGTGITVLPANVYVVFFNGYAYLTNASGFFFPLTSNYGAVAFGVTQKTFHYPWGSATTPFTGPVKSPSLNNPNPSPEYFYISDSYLELNVDRAVGAGSVNATGGTENDLASWTLYFSTHSHGQTNYSRLELAGPLSITSGEGSKLPSGLRSVSISAKGTGSSRYDYSSRFYFFNPYGLNSFFIGNVAITLAGKGNAVGFNTGLLGNSAVKVAGPTSDYFWTSHK